MKLGLSGREQRTLLIGGVLAIIVLWVYGAYIMGPLRKEAAELGEQVRLAREQLRALEAVTANEAAVQTQHRQVSDTVKSLRSLLPAEEELPSIIELLSDLASQSQVKIQTIFPQRQALPAGGPSENSATMNGTTAEPLVYKDIIIQIDALGGYHDLGMFLSLIESGKKPMEVSSLQMSADSKDPRRHIIKLLIRSYFAMGGSSSMNAPILGTTTSPAATPSRAPSPG